MCGRYVRRSDKQKIAEHFAVHGPSLPDFGPSWNVTPQTFQPIVRLNRDTGEREIVLMRWGLIPFWAKDPKHRTAHNQRESRDDHHGASIQRGNQIPPLFDSCRCLL
jgi:putative SOS response-associated peptidase YedK